MSQDVNGTGLNGSRLRPQKGASMQHARSWLMLRMVACQIVILYNPFFLMHCVSSRVVGDQLETMLHTLPVQVRLRVD